MNKPPATIPTRLRWRYAIGVPLVHVLALAGLYFFSYTGLLVALIGLYVFGTLGINLCYHRLLTHRSFVVPLWLEHGLAILGVCSLQDTPAIWVAMHRMHHAHSDKEEDPHSPLVNLLWGHCGWLMTDNREFTNLNYYQRYAKDLLRDPFYLRLERNGLWFIIYLAQTIPFFFVGWVFGGLWFGISLMIWGVFVRTVLVWHITWMVNSVGHRWGYQSYDTKDSSRNSHLVALISNGDGWHNNHHADQRAARHGHRWHELDVTYYTIKLLECMGLVTNIVPVTTTHNHANRKSQEAI